MRADATLAPSVSLVVALQLVLNYIVPIDIEWIENRGGA